MAIVLGGYVTSTAEVCNNRPIWFDIDPGDALAQSSFEAATKLKI